VLAQSISAEGAVAQEASDWVEGYFQLYVDQIRHRPTIVTLVEGSRVLVPLGPVLLLTEVPMHYVGPRRVLEWPPDVWKTTLDPAARTIEVGQERITVPEEDWIERDGEIFLMTTYLERLLRSDVRVDLENLIISITDGPEFPAVLRSRRAQRRSIEAATSQFLDPRRFDGVPYPARSGGFVAGWSASVTQSSSSTSGLVRPTVGAGLLGGAAEVGLTSHFNEGLSPRVDEVLARYERVFPENDRVRRINVGTIQSNGVIARPMIGASITNEPWITPRYFDQTALAPAVPTGWEYEVYQGNRLVGVSSADAPREIEAPLSYGSTPVRVRMIGPAGQERIQELVYFVPSTQIPSGRTRYSLGGGACDGIGCDAYAFAELGHGLSRRLTAYVGSDYLALPEQTDVQPYARVGFAATGSLNLGLQARGSSFLRADMRNYWGRSGQLAASYSWSRPEAGMVGSAGWIGQVSASAPVAGGPWLHGRLFLRGLEANRLDAWQAALSTNLGLTNLGVEVESGLQGRTITTGRVQQTFVRGLPRVIDNISVGTGLGAAKNGIELVEARAQLRTRQGATVNVQFRSRRDFDPLLTLGLTIQSPLGSWFGHWVCVRSEGRRLATTVLERRGPGRRYRRRLLRPGR
jgi:hypothetical protein